MESVLVPRPVPEPRDAVLDGAQAHLPRMLRAARGILGSDDLAWDAVQAALTALWHEREIPRDLRSWLVRTVVHRSLHLARSARRRERHEAGSWTPRAAREDDPALACDDAALAEHLARAIDGLPPELGAAFRLRELEGLGYAAIAVRLRVPLGTVRSRLHRAKQRLRAELSGRFDDEGDCRLCASRGARRRA
jgi:RNA polymerase sigma-70 factor (ECF subfamily)